MMIDVIGTYGTITSFDAECMGLSVNTLFTNGNI